MININRLIKCILVVIVLTTLFLYTSVEAKTLKEMTEEAQKFINAGSANVNGISYDKITSEFTRTRTNINNNRCWCNGCSYYIYGNKIFNFWSRSTSKIENTINWCSSFRSSYIWSIYNLVNCCKNCRNILII